MELIETFLPSLSLSINLEEPSSVIIFHPLSIDQGGRNSQEYPPTKTYLPL